MEVAATQTKFAVISAIHRAIAGCQQYRQTLPLYRWARCPKVRSEYQGDRPEYQRDRPEYQRDRPEHQGQRPPFTTFGGMSGAPIISAQVGPDGKPRTLFVVGIHLRSGATDSADCGSYGGYNVGIALPSDVLNFIVAQSRKEDKR
jgi:hypothetical protein